MAPQVSTTNVIQTMDADVDRKALVVALVRYEGPIDSVLEKLALHPWDSEELVRVGALDVVAVLNRYLGGDLSPEQLIDWANLLEVRDDVGFPLGDGGVIREIIFRLANPRLHEPVTPDLVRRIRSELVGRTEISGEQAVADGRGPR